MLALDTNTQEAVEGYFKDLGITDYLNYTPELWERFMMTRFMPQCIYDGSVSDDKVFRLKIQ